MTKKVEEDKNTTPERQILQANNSKLRVAPPPTPRKSRGIRPDPSDYSTNAPLGADIPVEDQMPTQNSEPTARRRLNFDAPRSTSTSYNITQRDNAHEDCADDEAYAKVNLFLQEYRKSKMLGEKALSTSTAFADPLAAALTGVPSVRRPFEYTQAQLERRFSRPIPEPRLPSPYEVHPTVVRQAEEQTSRHSSSSSTSSQMPTPGSVVKTGYDLTGRRVYGGQQTFLPPPRVADRNKVVKLDKTPVTSSSSSTSAMVSFSPTC